MTAATLPTAVAHPMVSLSSFGFSDSFLFDLKLTDKIVYNDCWSKCCGTTKVWEMRKQRNNSWKNVNVYPGVPCAE